MFTAIEQLPREEAEFRQARCRTYLAVTAPEAGGLLVFSRLNIYYLTGVWADGVVWLPLEGEPVLLVRRGMERCRLESPLRHVVEYASYAQIPVLCAEAGSPLSSVLAAEMGSLPWTLADQLRDKLKGYAFIAGDRALMLTRAIKTSWERRKLFLAGQRHDQALCDVLPAMLRPGMTEREIAVAAWKVFYRFGHGGMNRMGNYGEDVFLGHIAAGENGNYPSHFNGPLGLKGEHPAIPFMGSPDSVWARQSPLALDIGFMLEGYHTDKTQLYWAGSPASVPDAVRRAQDAALELEERAGAALKVGAIPSDIWKDACERARVLGVAEGFMGLGDNKVAFLGHGIGLVIDEYPVLAQRFDEPLEEGMILAIEPKIGLPGIGMVGVENTFEVTPQGGRCLTGTRHDMICLE